METSVSSTAQNMQGGGIDIISGGFPCQPFSHAGKRKGQADDRYLWPEMLRVIREVKPSFIVGENVAGLISMENGKTLDNILSDLANEGYTTEQFIIPACGVGAWHRRDRIWIIAKNTRQLRCNGGKWKKESNLRRFGKFGTGNLRRVYTESSIADTISGGQQGQREYEQSISTKEKEDRKTTEFRTGRSSDIWSIEPSVGRVANGIPNRVDRLKGLGNAIVPQIAFEIFKAIEQVNNLNYEST